MNILITNHSIRFRSGTEMYCLDLALALARRGHDVKVFTDDAGPVASEFSEHGIDVLSSLEPAHWKPDIIQGQHLVQTALAALSFPDTPVINVCHGLHPWQEEPVRLPNIVRYAAVSRAVQKRVAEFLGEGAREVDLLPNFADLSRFREVRTPAEEPKRALFFNNNLTDQDSIAMLSETCGSLGIEIDFVGRSSGNAVKNPEDVLPGYDLVFAVGRSAIEAMASGSAVILADAHRLGPAVSTENFDTVREANFALSADALPAEAHSPGPLRSALASYDASDAAAVTARVREECCLERYCDTIEAFYEKTKSEFAPMPPGAARSPDTPGIKRVLGVVSANLHSSRNEQSDLQGSFRALQGELRRAKERANRLAANLEKSKSKIRSLQEKRAGLEDRLVSPVKWLRWRASVLRRRKRG